MPGSEEIRRSLAGQIIAGMPSRVTETMTVGLLTSEENGHVFDRGGLHIGWSWGREATRGDYLELLWEHRMAGINASRYWPDGSIDPIPTPLELRRTSKDPVEEARLVAEYVEHNRRAYADLRERGLLPPVGDNAGSQDINEYLRTRPVDE